MLAQHNPAQLHLFCRSAEKASLAIAEIKSGTLDAHVTFIEYGLFSLSSVQKAADGLIPRSARREVLMCSAGLSCLQPKLTVDGYDILFGVNHLAHTLLTELLLPTLSQTRQAGNL